MVLTREDFKPLISEALVELGGEAAIFQVSKYVWDNYHHKISKSEKLLYTWQYDIRWAAQQLRDEGKLYKGSELKRKGIWKLK